MPSRLPRAALAPYAAVLALPLVLTACSGGGDEEADSPASSSASSAAAGSSDSATTASAASEDPSVCGYLYEWLSVFQYPLQPDPHAAYTYVVPQITDEPVALEITGDFPYAAWTSWTVYDDAKQGAMPVSVVKDSDIVPEQGSENPFVVGTPVLSPDREFRLLVLPKGTDPSGIDASLSDVPADNVLTRPTKGDYFILANRVYNAFPGYNLGGAVGPTNTPFPQVRTVNYETGDPVDCSKVNLLPSPRSPQDMPQANHAVLDAVPLTNGEQLTLGPQASRPGHEGLEYAPALDARYIEFTRPPILPGADVPSVPPPDSCAGYLGAQTSTTKIGLIRIPHVATWFDTRHLTDTTPFEQKQSTFFSLTQYGTARGAYRPGRPQTASLGNEELQVDTSGGSTILVWPRSLSRVDQRQVFDLARRQGWALLRGDAQGPATTPNLFVRMKGSSESYQGGYTPTPERDGVPCYFDDHPQQTHWYKVTGDKYVASPANIGPGAPQGVNCTTEELLGGRCLSMLKAYIDSTGGSYSTG
jgi:hypothetical protein